MKKRVTDTPNDSNFMGRRKLILGLIAAGVITVEEATVGCIRKGLLDATQDEQTQTPEEPDAGVALAGKPFELNECIKAELEPFTQSEMNLGSVQAMYDRSANRAQGLYSRTRDPKMVMLYMNQLLADESSKYDERSKAHGKWLVVALHKAKVLDELSALRKENQQKGTAANLVLIPQVHSQDGASSLNARHKQQIDASDRNITGIIGVLKRFSPKIYVEAHSADISVDEDVEMKIISSYGTPESIESARQSIESDKKKKPWIYDKEYNVHGLEPVKLSAIVQEFYRICEIRVQCDIGLQETVLTVFSTLLREQLATEMILQKLNENELAVIVIGAGHMPTMQQYMKENHPQVKTETIIPKFR